MSRRRGSVRDGFVRKLGRRLKLHFDARRIATSGYFDAEFYLLNNPDVADEPGDPLWHFLLHGGREGRSPSERFDVGAYLRSNPPARSAANPVLDWLSEGKAGRRAAPRPLEGYERKEGRSSRSDGVSASRWRRDTPTIANTRPKPLAPVSVLYNPKGLQISWIIPDFDPSGGGHMTIFRMVKFLEDMGHFQTVWIRNPRHKNGPEHARAVIVEHYRRIGARVHVRFLPDDVRQLSGDVVIATDFWTVYPACAATNFKERFYLIQDYEPYFHPMGEKFLLAQRTYEMGLAGLCAGPWLLEKARRHGMWARAWDLAVDHDVYRPRGRDGAADGSDARRRIAFYSRSHTARRAVPLGLAALEELARRRQDFEVLLFGEHPTGRPYGFPARELGILTPAELGEMYRSADVGVVFSTTNYSLAPLEMMACELPVVEIDSESARAAFPAGSVTFAKPSPVEVADALERLLDDEDARRAQIAAGGAFVAGLDWRDSATAIEAALLERLDQLGFQAVSPSKAAPALGRVRKASVIIPTYNGGALFEDVLRRTADQACDFDYDVLVIDSSSTDGTAAFARGFGGRVHCETIAQEDFQHGRTRNLAIGMTDGEVIAVLTQDATPQDAQWLNNLVAPFERHARVAGAIGRHRAYPEHNKLVGRDLDRMFDRFRDMGDIYSLERCPAGVPAGSSEWRSILHFYSDNNSAMRRSVWSLLPYPEIDWGEDQVWAWEMIKLGFAKAYADDAVVFHSHRLSQAAQTKVAISEADLMARHFGFHLNATPMGPQAVSRLRAESLAYAAEAGLPDEEAEDYVRLQTCISQGHALGLAGAMD